MVRNKEICSQLLHNEQFWSIGSIVANAAEQPWCQLPSNVKKTVIRSLVVCFAHSNESIAHMKQHFVASVLEPLAARLNTLVSSIAHSGELVHNEATIKETMSLVETLNGLVDGTTPGLVDHLLPFVLPRLEQAVHLLDVYHNYGEIVELILGLFNSVIERFLPHMTARRTDKNQLYHHFLCLIQVFSKHNTGS